MLLLRAAPVSLVLSVCSKTPALRTSRIKHSSKCCRICSSIQRVASSIFHCSHTHSRTPTPRRQRVKIRSPQLAIIYTLLFALSIYFFFAAAGAAFAATASASFFTAARTLAWTHARGRIMSNLHRKCSQPACCIQSLMRNRTVCTQNTLYNRLEHSPCASA